MKIVVILEQLKRCFNCFFLRILLKADCFPRSHGIMLGKRHGHVRKQAKNTKIFRGYDEDTLTLAQVGTF